MSEWEMRLGGFMRRIGRQVGTGRSVRSVFLIYLIKFVGNLLLAGNFFIKELFLDFTNKCSATPDTSDA